MTGASACGCGHHHARDGHGRPVPSGAQVALSGTFGCADAGQMMALLMHAPAHVAASRAEPGCLHFEIAQTDAPLVWRLDALFRDAAALDAHEARAAASGWAAATEGIARDLVRSGAAGA